MNFISLGRRRSIRICAAPSEPTPLVPRDPALAPRSFFSMASAPVVSPDMSNRPMRVSRVTSAPDMQHSMASQPSRRARSAGCTARIWSSRNSMVATTTLPRAMSA